ncbi:MAG: hypothetical protein LUH43_03090 [Clostridia bacterium]|nr:hypothetical protein [Clostridia bacterium]
MKTTNRRLAAALALAATLTFAVSCAETTSTGSETDTTDAGTETVTAEAETTEEATDSASAYTDYDITHYSTSHVLDPDNVVDAELLTPDFLGMTEAELYLIIGFPVELTGGGNIGLVYNVSDGSVCCIEPSVTGDSANDRVIVMYHWANKTDGTDESYWYDGEGNIYHCFYDSDTGDLLSSEVTEMTLSYDFDEDNVVSTELMESVYVGMTEADMFALIGYPSQSFGEEMRLVYYTDDGAKYFIRTGIPQSGITDEAIVLGIRYIATDGAKVYTYLLTNGSIICREYDADGELLTSDV